MPRTGKAERHRRRTGGDDSSAHTETHSPAAIPPPEGLHAHSTVAARIGRFWRGPYGCSSTPGGDVSGTVYPPISAICANQTQRAARGARATRRRARGRGPRPSAHGGDRTGHPTRAEGVAVFTGTSKETMLRPTSTRGQRSTEAKVQHGFARADSRVTRRRGARWQRVARSSGGSRCRRRIRRADGGSFASRCAWQVAGSCRASEESAAASAIHCRAGSRRIAQSPRYSRNCSGRGRQRRRSHGCGGLPRRTMLARRVQVHGRTSMRAPSGNGSAGQRQLVERRRWCRTGHTPAKAHDSARSGNARNTRRGSRDKGWGPCAHRRPRGHCTTPRHPRTAGWNSSIGHVGSERKPFPGAARIRP